MARGFDLAARPAMGQNFDHSQRCQNFANLRAEKTDTRNKFSAGRCVFTLSVSGQPAALDVTITSPLQPSIVSNAARTSGFASRAAGQKIFEQYSLQSANTVPTSANTVPTRCQHYCVTNNVPIGVGVHFILRAIESFSDFSKLVRKTLKQIALCTDNRSLRPVGLSVAFSRLAQLVALSLMRGNAIMMIARSADL